MDLEPILVGYPQLLKYAPGPRGILLSYWTCETVGPYPSTYNKCIRGIPWEALRAP
jgi:hypothetical protein